MLTVPVPDPPLVDDIVTSILELSIFSETFNDTPDPSIKFNIVVDPTGVPPS
jgi:hypothetical protein